MHITHEQLHDKIKVFAMAGDDTGAYDYALPDSMLKELVKMGVDNPGAWYIADCGRGDILDPCGPVES